MVERLEELNQLSSEYYPKAKAFYDIIKEQIIDNIIQINDLINSCEKVTIETIKNKYLEIKNKFKNENETENLIKTNIKISPYKSHITDNYFTVETFVQNYLIDNRLKLDMIFNEETNTPKIIGKLVNNVKPEKLVIDFYSTVGQDDKLGTMINVTFKNISSYSNIIFDSGLNQANIITNFDFDEYSVITKNYKEETENITQTILGVTYKMGQKKIKNFENISDEESIKNIKPKNITFKKNYFY